MLKKINDRARDIALSLPLIQQFSFEDLEEALTEKTINYPLFHLNTPSEVIIADCYKPYFDFKLEFFVFSLDRQFNSQERVDEWDKLEAIGWQFISEFVKEQSIAMLLSKRCVITRGHFEHQDSLIGIKFSTDIRFFENNCFKDNFY